MSNKPNLQDLVQSNRTIIIYGTAILLGALGTLLKNNLVFYAGVALFMIHIITPSIRHEADKRGLSHPWPIVVGYALLLCVIVGAALQNRAIMVFGIIFLIVWDIALRLRQRARHLRN